MMSDSVRFRTATDKERELCNIIVDALIAADAEFNEEEISNALGHVKGAILTIMFRKN